MGKLYFIRHGETIWNVENKICGASDIALTKHGHEQAIEAGQMILAEQIAADEILYSPLIRAKDTALHISDITKIPAREEPRLIEQNFGKYESTARNGAEFKKSKENFADNYGGGESMLRLGQRIFNLLDEITSSDKVYILVAHNGIARMVNAYFNDMSNAEYAAFGVKNCSVTRYDWNDAINTTAVSTSTKKYGFWGYESATVPALTSEYIGINTPIDLYEALTHIFCKETCAPRMQEDWIIENMTLGQCSITAFLVQDIFGGKVYGVLRPGGNYHCYNVIGDSKFDLTSEQFTYGTEYDDASMILDYNNNPEQFREDHFAKEEKKARYELLKSKLRDYLATK